MVCAILLEILCGDGCHTFLSIAQMPIRILGRETSSSENPGTCM